MTAQRLRQEGKEMDDFKSAVESLFAQYKDICIAEKLIPFAIITTTKDGDMKVFYNTELSIDDMIANLDQVSDYLEDVKNKSEDN